MNRRNFVKLAGLGGVVFASALARGAGKYASRQDEFFFVQLSDTHWGFQGAAVNPDAAGTLPKAIAAVNALETQPDFVVFTGDLTHTTDDPRERRRRLSEFRDLVRELKTPNVRFMPGEHDAALDNVSDRAARIGSEQLGWLKADLEKRKRDDRIVVLTHRPLFPLYPQWDWATRDGEQALELLMPYRNVVVFYGHIHQEHHFKTGHIEHHSAKSLIFPLPAPGSMPKREPIKWDAGQPYRGLGYREVEAEAEPVAYRITELPVIKA